MGAGGGGGALQRFGPLSLKEDFINRLWNTSSLLLLFLAFWSGLQRLWAMGLAQSAHPGNEWQQRHSKPIAPA